MNIIEQIIEIDSIAQKKLNDAYNMEQNTLSDTSDKIESIRADIDQKAKEKLKKIQADEYEKSEHLKKQIKAQTDSSINKLNDLFQNNHLSLENTIYSNVLE